MRLYHLDKTQIFTQVFAYVILTHIWRGQNVNSSLLHEASRPICVLRR